MKNVRLPTFPPPASLSRVNDPNRQAWTHNQYEKGRRIDNPHAFFYEKPKGLGNLNGKIKAKAANLPITPACLGQDLAETLLMQVK